MKLPAIALLASLGWILACQSSPAPAGVPLSEDSGLEEVTILAKGLE